jgi:DNA-binding transcriptional LysR family regulator
MSLPNLEPELLRAFLAVAQHLSFTSAADGAYIGNGATSRARLRPRRRHA